MVVPGAFLASSSIPLAPPVLPRANNAVVPNQLAAFPAPQAVEVPRRRANRNPVLARAVSESNTQRRRRESQRVDERITQVYNISDFDKELREAGHELVVLEVEASDICQTGFDEEPEVHYKADQEAVLAPCKGIKHALQRTARDSPDVRFLALEADTEEGRAACKELGVDVLPTIQFWRDGQKLWEHKGIVQLDNNLGEGVLYYGDIAANNVRASDHVEEVTNRQQLDAWLGKLGKQELGVLDVSLTSASPCVHIFPAVLALAKNMVGYASFARLMADASEEGSQIAREFDVVQAPTFIFFREGKEVGRHVGSTRGDLIGQILQQQSVLGLAPPPAPARSQ